MAKNKIQRTAEDNAISVFIFIVMLFVFIVTVYPFYYCVVISFNEGINASIGGIYFWPRKFTLENYVQVFSNQQLMPAFGVSIIRTVVGTLCSVFFTGLVAFAVSHKNLIGRNLYTNMMIVAMYFSGGLIPYFLVIKNLGLYNTFWVYIIPGLLGIWNCILMMNFFRSIPEALEESARIDGANDLTIFFRIIVPVSMPVIATVMLFNGVGHWNDWYTTSFYTKDKSLRTASYILKELISQANLTSITGSDAATAARAADAAARSYTAESLRMATMVVVVVPIVCVYPFLQKYFVKGVMIGSIKG
ncbi:MAG: carbohydrate ABC transporter permease [Clostridia bacterium]|nr:carbohydrate ABC transporter permease [Clostridia bacterium]